MEVAYFRRWFALLAFASQRAFAATLVSEPHELNKELHHPLDLEPTRGDLLVDSRYEAWAAWAASEGSEGRRGPPIVADAPELLPPWAPETPATPEAEEPQVGSAGLAAGIGLPTAGLPEMASGTWVPGSDSA